MNASGLGQELRSRLARPPLRPEALSAFRRERLTDLTLPIGYALLEGGFVGVIADKVFEVDPIWIAFVTAAPMFGNLSSALWARLAQRRRKVPLLVGLQGMLIALVASIGLSPASGWGGAWLIAAMVAGRLVIGGIQTVRSIVWTQNYPGGVRARVTWRLAFRAQLVMTVMAALGGVWLDRYEHEYALLYLLGAAVASVGAASYSRVRMAGEEPGQPPVGSGVTDARGRRLGFLRLLREDRAFRQYQAWHFLLGSSNMTMEPIAVYAVSHERGADYATSIAVVTVLPVGLAMLTMPLFAAWLDRLHIAEFRSRHSWLWAISQATTGVGILTGSLGTIALGRAILGLARGGGALAWNLGHNDFAHPDRAGLYMGVHATLTGVRGAFAPFLGIALYVGWGGLEGYGGGFVLVAALLSTIATLGFGRLSRNISRSTWKRA